MGAIPMVGLGAGAPAKSVLEAIRSDDRFEVAALVAGRRLMVSSRWCPAKRGSSRTLTRKGHC
jgi:hypothetical protein